MLLKTLGKLLTTMLMTVAIGVGIVLFSLLMWLFWSEDPKTLDINGYSYTSLQGDFDTTASGILIIPVHGMILGQKPTDIALPMLLQQDYVTYGSEIKQMILDAIGNDSVQAILLDIDSPGGTVFGTKMIVDAMLDCKKAKKPIYAHIVGEGDSGGYRVASTADKVYAELGSNIGSIGVIAGPFKYYEEVISEWDATTNIQAYSANPSRPGGIHTTYITAGKYKDFGNPYRKMSEEEKINMQRNLDEIYSGFVAHVARYRNLSGDVIKKKYGAHVFVDARAKEKKLIDGTANREQLMTMLAKKLGTTADKLHIMTVQSPTSFFGWLPFVGSTYQASTSKLNTKTLLQTAVCSTVQPLVYHGDMGTVCGK